MMSRRALMLALLMVACMQANAQSPEEYHVYFTEAFSQYGESVADCEALRQTRQPPPVEIIRKVAQYTLQDTRVFLMYNDFKRMQQCSSDAATELLIASGSLRNKENLLNDTRQAIQALEDTLFIGTDLQFEIKYRQLPKTMRRKLEKVDYFKTPFQAYSILDEIEASDSNHATK